MRPTPKGVLGMRDGSRFVSSSDQLVDNLLLGCTKVGSLPTLGLLQVGVWTAAATKGLGRQAQFATVHQLPRRHPAANNREAAERWRGDFGSDRPEARISPLSTDKQAA